MIAPTGKFCDEGAYDQAIDELFIFLLFCAQDAARDRGWGAA
jgi:hypothetical protein